MSDIHILDLPPLHTHPSSSQLLTTLTSLTQHPQSFTSDSNSSPPNTSTSIPTYLTSIISSSLSWLPEPQREQIWTAASHRIAERAGRTAAPSLTRTFTIAGSEILIHEPTLTADNLGHKTWSSSYLLASQIENWRRYVPAASKQLDVLELGAGTGLFGLGFAVRFPGSSVCLTDLDEIVPNLACNVLANAEVFAEGGSRVLAETLDWNDTPRLGSMVVGNYDVVLASDPIYEPGHTELLTRAVVANLARGRGARFVLGVPLREAYLVQIEELWGLLGSVGLSVVEEGVVEGFDDWMDRFGERVVVRVRWAVWAWEEEES